MDKLLKYHDIVYNYSNEELLNEMYSVAMGRGKYGYNHKGWMLRYNIVKELLEERLSSWLNQPN